ncbi:cAMP-dependent protein kinase type II regulatory subunit [Hetaerina americana]|uniref:cAMP-dependent protein kinase type II regulatory subunit n=1 Tax=Hetaerina americana TaxID=62018 RepID=UPI003A7F6039
MSRSSLGRHVVPNELRDILVEFIVNYVQEQPVDLMDYAVDFFTKLRDKRHTTVIPGVRIGSALTSPQGYTDSEEEDEPPVARFATRRKSVFAETYDPEEDDEEAQKAVYPKSDEQRLRLADAVKNILLFRELDEEQMQEVLDAMFERKVKPGEYVIKQGDDGDNFYVIESGVYITFVELPGEKAPRQVHKYEGCGSFGELALMYNMPRAATIQAAEDGSLWAMDRLTFRRILLKSAFRKRRMYESLIESVPMLKTLEPYERMNLADALVPRSFMDGERIIVQGDSADGMYFVKEGKVCITISNDNKEEVEISRIEKGGYFGELALVTHKPRAASAYACGNIKLAFLDVEAFERLLGPCMQIMKRNIGDYEEQLVRIFGSKTNITDVR